MSSDTDSGSKKNSGAKSNGYDSEVRQATGPGQELEVIIESDTRSECSEQHKGSEESGKQSGERQSESGSSVPEPQTTVEDEKCQITVSKSSQQLRKQFFDTSSKQDVRDDMVESSQDSTFTSKAKCPEKHNEELEKPFSSSSFMEDKGAHVITNESIKKNKAEITTDGSNTNIKSLEKQPLIKPESKVLTKQYAVSDGTTSRNGKSPILSKKEKKSSTAKLSHDNSEPSVSKLSLEEKDTSNQGKNNTLKASAFQKIKSESKTDFAAEKKEKSLQKPSSSSDSVNETLSASKSSAKSTKLQEHMASGKPPSGSNRQRKKATSKTPNKDSIDSKRKPEGDKR